MLEQLKAGNTSPYFVMDSKNFSDTTIVNQQATCLNRESSTTTREARKLDDIVCSAHKCVANTRLR